MVQSDNDHSLKGILSVLDTVYRGAISFNKLNIHLSNITQSYYESVMDYFSRLTQLHTRLMKHHGHMYREGQLDKQVKEASIRSTRPLCHISRTTHSRLPWTSSPLSGNAKRMRRILGARGGLIMRMRTPLQCPGHLLPRLEETAMEGIKLIMLGTGMPPELTGMPYWLKPCSWSKSTNGEDLELELLTNFYGHQQ